MPAGRVSAWFFPVIRLEAGLRGTLNLTRCHSHVDGWRGWGFIVNIRYSTETRCSICLEPYDESQEHEAYRLNCQHAFGRKCINEWALRSNKCPVCGLDTFPAELSGRLDALRRLEQRIIFIHHPETIFLEAFFFFGGLAVTLILIHMLYMILDIMLYVIQYILLKS